MLAGGVRFGVSAASPGAARPQMPTGAGMPARAKIEDAGEGLAARRALHPPPTPRRTCKRPPGLPGEPCRGEFRPSTAPELRWRAAPMARGP